MPRFARTALLSIAAVPVLLAGSLVLVSPARASSFGCLGASCDGKGPIAEGCSSDAVTAYNYSHLDVVLDETVHILLRYSPGCRSVWAKVYADANSECNCANGQEFWVYNENTGKEETNKFIDPSDITTMVGDAGTHSHACLYYYDTFTDLAKLCTDYY